MTGLLWLFARPGVPRSWLPPISQPDRFQLENTSPVGKDHSLRNRYYQHVSPDRQANNYRLTRFLWQVTHRVLAQQRVLPQPASGLWLDSLASSIYIIYSSQPIRLESPIGTVSVPFCLEFGTMTFCLVLFNQAWLTNPEKSPKSTRKSEGFSFFQRLNI